MLWLKDWVRESQIHSFIFFIFFIFFNRVAQVNSEYQLSHLSPTDSRPSLGINLYLVLDSSRLTSRWIRLSRFFEPWFRRAAMVPKIQRPSIHNVKRKAKKHKNEKTKKNPTKNRELSNCKKLS